MPKPKSDAVHRYFKFDNANNYSKCQLCEKKIKGKHTSNLKNHLAVKHTLEYKIVEEINNNDQSTIINDNCNTKAVEKIQKLCMQLVTVHGRPLTMVEDEAFQDIVKMALPSNADPKQINIKVIMEKIFYQVHNIKDKIQNEIKNQLISLKLDSATCAERKFVGVNIQYIKKAEIVVRNLAVVEIHESETGTLLKQKLEEVLTEFNINTDHIYCVCKDNAANMIKMVKLVEGKYCIEDEQSKEDDESSDSDVENDEYSEIKIEEQNLLTVREENSGNTEFENFFTNFEVKHIITSKSEFNIRGMVCAAHTLQLVIKDAINRDVSVQETINLAQKIVNILRKPKNLNKLRSKNLKKPINSCKTRWTSTYNMLQRLINLKDFCSKINQLNSLVSSNFWTELISIVECLQPAHATSIILQQQNLTIGDFYIAWVKCKDQIELINHPFATNICNGMQECEKQLFQNDVVLESLFLDSCLNLILDHQQHQKATALLTESFRQFQKLKQLTSNEISNSENEPENDLLPKPSTSRGSFSLEERLIRADKLRRHITSFDDFLNELAISPRISLNENIISYWNNRVVFTDFLMFVNTVLAAPATQVSVETLFSSLKFILNPLRSNLSTNFLKDLLVVRNNKDLLD